MSVKPPIIDVSLKERLGLLNDQGQYRVEEQDSSIESAIAKLRGEYKAAHFDFDQMQKAKATKTQFGRLFTHATLASKAPAAAPGSENAVGEPSKKTTPDRKF